MSKRIDELWGQALDQAVPDTYSSLSWTQVEKIKAVFAELIVKECAAMAKGFEFAVERDGLSKAMKEHFGVEE